MADSLDSSRKPVLVPGASGFIGARLDAALSAATTCRPVAACRRPGANGIAWNAIDPTALRAALRDLDHVVTGTAGSDRTMVQAPAMPRRRPDAMIAAAARWLRGGARSQPHAEFSLA
ncbi:hypothetical protein [Rhodopila globiformis]|uniref:hypothetical protein n=1 Tax=Rhodopila globiformis TaxID=1071 RepID=UPI001304EA7E|nr:hypothetical protein [Rhodopila globiformis]